jgi:hypothetical protein
VRVTARLPDYWRHVGAIGVLLALVLRFAVPTGYMLAGDGSLAIVPCPAAGPMPATMPSADSANLVMHMDHAMHGAMAHDRQAPANHPNTSCPYAALSAPILPPQPPLFEAIERLTFTEFLIPAVRHLATPTLAAPPPPSRGPPILS